MTSCRQTDTGVPRGCRRRVPQPIVAGPETATSTGHRTRASSSAGRMGAKVITTGVLLAFVAVAAAGTRAMAVPIAPQIEGVLHFDQRQDGNLGDENRYDLYSVTVPQNGRLRLSLQGSPSTNGSLELFDVNGVLSSTYRIRNVSLSGGDTHTMDAWLKAGTYFVRVNLSQNEWLYRLTPSFTAAQYARDAQPNHTFKQAQMMPTNGSVSGHIGYFSHGFTDTHDWWTVTMPASGHLQIELRGTELTNGYLHLFDADGITRLERFDLRHEDVSQGSVERFMGPGTYYILVERTGNAWEYILENTFTSAGLDDSYKPNNTWHVAAPLAPGGQARGHLRYYSHGTWYGEDWYKVTTTQEGALEVTLTVSADYSGARGRMRLHSPDWTQERSATFNIDALPIGAEEEQITVVSDNFRPGTYYVRIERTAEQFAYDLSSRFISGTVEPRGADGASLMNLGGSATGALHADNTADWYAVTIPTNGLLQFKLAADEATRAYLDLRDINGTTRLQRVSIWDTRTDSVSFKLAAGTYYVQVERYGNATFSYTLTNSFEPATWAADTEPNDHFTLATSIPLNSETTGHIGHRINSQIDREDWYAIEITENGLLSVQMEAAAGTRAYLALYDVDGTTRLERNSIWDARIGTVTHHLAPGTYYVQVEQTSSSVFSYTLTNSFEPAIWEADQEPNDHFTTPIEIEPVSVVTGHLGYRSFNHTDIGDWYAVKVLQNGELRIGVEMEEATRAYLNLYDVNGVTRLERHSLWDARDGEVSRHLAPGTYYALIERSSSSIFSYRLTTSFTPAALPRDPEYNDYPAAAVPLTVNTQTTGHLGYYSDGWRDDADFYRVEVEAMGHLYANLAANADMSTFIRIYNADGDRLASHTARGVHPGSVKAESLMPGTYFIGVEASGHRILSYILSTSLVPSGDESAPRILSTFPAGEDIVSTRNFVHITFSREMDPGSINNETFTLMDSQGNIESGDVSYTGTVATFIPHFPLEVDETYTATIVSAQDTGLRPLVDAPYSWSFTVGASEVDLEDPSTAVTEETGILPDGVRLAPNYPNPFNSRTQIGYTLPAAAPVQLEVFSITGQRVAVLVSEHQPAGWHTVSFEAADLASGVYIARLRAGRQVHTRTMLLLK